MSGQPLPPETASDRIQGAAMVLFLAVGFALAVMALRTPAAQRQLGAALDLSAIVDGRAAAAVNSVMSHDLPVDAALREAGGVLRWRVFGSGGPQVWAGRDGWLFLIEELRPFPDAGRAMQARVETVALVRRALAARGIALVVAVVPDKARVVAAAMDGPRSAQADRRYADLAQMLTAAAVPFVDLAAPFAAVAGPLYYRTDTHWNQAGAALAAGRIAAASAAVPLTRGHDFVTTPDPVPTPFAGDLLRLMSLERVPDGLVPPLRPPADLQQVEHTKDTTPAAPAAGLLDDAPAVEVALLGSSFSVNANFAGRLAEALHAEVGQFAQAGGAFAGAARAYLAGATFREAPPRLVIWEFPERVMGQPLGPDDDALRGLAVSLDATPRKP